MWCKTLATVLKGEMHQRISPFRSARKESPKDSKSLYREPYLGSLLLILVAEASTVGSGKPLLHTFCMKIRKYFSVRAPHPIRRLPGDCIRFKVELR